MSDRAGLVRLMPRATTAIDQSYDFGTFVADFGVGFAALVIVVCIALLLGGFSFLAPWLLVTPPLFFATGFVRGRSAGTIWGKGMAMSAGPLLLLALGNIPVGCWRWFRVLQGWRSGVIESNAHLIRITMIIKWDSDPDSSRYTTCRRATFHSK